MVGYEVIRVGRLWSGEDLVCERIFSICGELTAGRRNRMKEFFLLAQKNNAGNQKGLCPSIPVPIVTIHNNEYHSNI